MHLLRMRNAQKQTILCFLPIAISKHVVHYIPQIQYTVHPIQNGFGRMVYSVWNTHIQHRAYRTREQLNIFPRCIQRYIYSINLIETKTNNQSIHSK